MSAKPHLRWTWSSYLQSYRARTNGYLLTVWLDESNAWMIEIERANMFQTSVVARCKGRHMLVSTQVFAESRLLRLVREESRRAERIENLLGA